MAQNLVAEVGIVDNGQSAQTIENLKKYITQLESTNQKLMSNMSHATEKAANSYKPFRAQLREAKNDVLRLAQEYEKMDAAMRSSSSGLALKADLDAAKQSYADLVDFSGDLNEEIKNMASDTKGWDAMAQGAQILGGAISTTASIMGAFTDSEEEAMKMMNLAKGIQTGFNTVVTIGNALQKQSALMVGIRAAQEWLAAKATAANATATAAETASTTASTTAAAANAVAKEAETAATEHLTVAQMALNAASKANPYILLGTTLAAVAGGIYLYTTAHSKAEAEEKKHREEVEKLRKAEEDFRKEVSTTSGKLIATYKTLEQTWKSLDSTTKKTQWIKEHKSQFRELGISINSIADAELAFVKRGDAIVKSLIARAKASAYAAVAEQKYAEAIAKQMDIEKKAIRTGDKYDSLTSSQKEAVGRLDKNNPNVQYMGSRGVGGGGGGYWAVTNKGATEANRALIRDSGYQDLMDTAEKLIKESQKYTEESLKLLGNLAYRPDPEKTNKEKEEKTPQKTVAEAEKEYKLTVANEKKKLDDTGDKAAYDSALLKATEQLISVYVDNMHKLDSNNNVVEALSQAEKERLKELRKSAADQRLQGFTSAEKKYDYTVEQTQKSVSTGAISYDEGLKDLVKARKTLRDYIINVAKDLGGFEKLPDTLKEKFRQISIPKFNELQPNNPNNPTNYSSKFSALVQQTKDINDVIGGMETFGSSLGELTSIISQNATELKAARNEQAQQNFNNAVAKAMQPKTADFTANIKSDTIERNKGLDELIEQYKELAEVVQKANDTMASSDITIDTSAAVAQMSKLQTSITTTVQKDEKHQNTMKLASESTDFAAKSLQSLGSAFSNLAEEGAAAKAGAILAAVGSIVAGFASAMASPASTAAGIFAWVGGAFSGFSTLTALVAQMQKFSTGGIVKGSTAGFGPSGDGIVARLNPGEMVLNHNQQSQLFRLLNGGGGVSLTNGVVEFYISGHNLRGVLNNYDKKMSKIR